MIKYYFYILLFLSFSILSAQEKLTKEERVRREKNIKAGNPFVKYGCKAPVATLSKGKYLEVHDLDSIVIIGTTRWHVYKKIIVGEIKIDSLNLDAQPTGDVPGMWMSPDPLSEEYPSWNPYNYCKQNPINLIDPDGRDPGDYYGKNGEHLGKDKYIDNKVYAAESVQKDKDGYVTSAKNSIDLTKKYGITHSDFLNRANWVYGEGGGNFTDYYAHTIQNLKEHGVWGPANKPFKSDEAMFKSKMTHKSNGKILNMYPGYFNGTDGNFNSKAFANLRGDLDELTSNTGMRNSIQSVIGSIMGTTVDPTIGAYQWVG